MGLGGIVIAVAWYVAAGEATFAQQVGPVDAALAGLLLSGVGNLAWLLHGRRTLGERRRLLLPDIVAATASADAQAVVVRPTLVPHRRGLGGRRVPGRRGHGALPPTRVRLGRRPNGLDHGDAPAARRSRQASLRGMPPVSSSPSLLLSRDADGALLSRQTLMKAGGLAALVVVGLLLTAAFSVGPYVVTGIADGSIYALAALGLVLTYKTSGIFNFAIGAQAAASAYVFYSLRDSSASPGRVAALFSLILVGLVGSLLLERIAFWLTGASAAMKVVATIALVVLLESVLTGIYGVATIQFTSFLPARESTSSGSRSWAARSSCSPWPSAPPSASTSSSSGPGSACPCTPSSTRPPSWRWRPPIPSSSDGTPGPSGPASSPFPACCWRPRSESTSTSTSWSTSPPSGRRRSARSAACPSPSPRRWASASP